jgi:hypothetical protein
MLRRVLLCTTLVAGAAVAAPAAPANAFVVGCSLGFDCYTTYYSGPDLQEVVGWRDINCVGAESFGGTMTAWSTTVKHECG